MDVNTAAIDFGFFYSVGETGLKFSVGISNFGFDANPSGSTFRESPSGGVIEEDEFENVELPTRFVIASAYEAVRGNTHTLTLTGQITNPSDNSEQLSIGGEYGFVNQFFVRAGYQFGTDEIEFPSLGAGVRMPFGQRNIFADYSYNTFDRLGDVHRISLRITF